MTDNYFRGSESHTPVIMGILNVTPDSFSDGGRFYSEDDAYRHAMDMIEEGADIIDAGGESSRPGSSPVPVSEEIKRVIPVIKKIRRSTGHPISIDTTRMNVASEAMVAGANIINDISAMEYDPGMLPFVTENNIPVILMHKKGTPAAMQNNPEYKNVTEEVNDYLKKRVDIFIENGGKRNLVAIDPGFGFGKTFEHNMELIRNINVFVRSGVAVLAGVSRKSFIGKIMNEPQPANRLEGSLAAAGYCFMNGVRFFRVHDVALHRKFLDSLTILSSHGIPPATG